MSAPQPPNQPWQGGQPQQEPQQDPQSGPQQEPERTQVLQPGQASGQQQPQDTGPEPTQVVHPGQPVHPGHQGESTQMVPPGSMPPPAPQYEPPPSASDQPPTSPPGGFPGPGPQQQTQVLGQYGQPPQFGQPPPGQPQPQPGFGPPPGYQQPGGFAQQPGFGPPPQFGGQGTNSQMITWIVAGVAAILGLITAILVLVDFGDLSDYATAYDQASSFNERAAAELPSPTLMWILAIATLLGGLAAVGAGVMIFLKNKIGATLLLVGGGLMLLGGLIWLIAITSDSLEAFGFPVLGLIAGIVVAGLGALQFFPQTKAWVGLGGSAFGPPQAGGFQQPPPPGYGPPQGYGQQPPPGYGHQPPPPGYGQQPPPGYGQQPPPGYGQPPQQPPQQW